MIYVLVFIDEVKFSEADVNECVFKMETEDHPDLQSSSGKPPKENKRTWVLILIPAFSLT